MSSIPMGATPATSSPVKEAADYVNKHHTNQKLKFKRRKFYRGRWYCWARFGWIPCYPLRRQRSPYYPGIQR